MVAIGIMTVVGLTMRLHPGPAWRGVNPELRVLNFNIQQGFSRSGSVNYDSIYNMLDVERPHITTFAPSFFLSNFEMHFSNIFGYFNEPISQL